jgi:SAM-dependent methyltransferase
MADGASTMAPGLTRMAGGSAGPSSAGAAGPLSQDADATLPLSQEHGVVYALGHSPAEQDRLRHQAAELRPDSEALLDRVGIAAGGSAIDVGCGPEGILGLLAERVGPAGQVTGLEINPASVAQARRFAAERGHLNVQVVEADARSTGLPSGSYDLVHARTLLINATDPAAVLTEMVRLARPGGWIAVLEPDAGTSVCYPPHPSWDRMDRIWADVSRAYGTDAQIGRRLPELFRQAGLASIGTEVRADIYPHGHSRRTVRPDLLRSMRAQILAKGIADERELDEVDRAVRQHLNDPDTLVMPNLLFLAWGRVPAGAQ